MEAFAFTSLMDKLNAIDGKLDKIMADLTNLNAADTALQSEVAEILTDIVTALAGVNDQAGVDAVTADLNTQIAKLKAGDPIQTPIVNPPVPTS